MSSISMPLSSNNAASERSSPRRSHRTHHANVSNPHLQVLGRDGQDLPLFEDHNTIHTTTTSTPPVHAAVAAVAHPLSTGKQWWNSVWNAHKQEQEITTTYASLNGEAATATAAQVQPATTVTTAVTPFTSSLSTTTTTTTPTTTLSPSAAIRALLTETTTKHNSVPTNSTTSSSHYTNALQSPQATMQEDLIRQDCSFFYRDMDEVAVSPRTRNALTTTTTLPPRQQSAYRARYQQLNQDYILQQDDLELYTYASEDEEEDAAAAPFCTPSLSSSRMCSDVFVTNSSLYYKHNNGRVLMKLPKDKVRLVMDPELGEPGILSAIVSKNNNNGNKDDDDDDDNSISYILTVHPDLYRKVVLDLAQTSSCLWETQDQVSMRVAVLLLVGILLILFIFTLIYPGD